MISCPINSLDKPLSLFSTRQDLSHDAKFFEVTHAYFIPMSKVNEVRMRNFEKFRIARKTSTSGKQEAIATYLHSLCLSDDFVYPTIFSLAPTIM